MSILLKIRKFMFERSLSIADWWAISFIALLGDWFWLAVIPWIVFSVYMQRYVES